MLRGRGGRATRLACLALVCAGLICLFFNEVLFQGRTFGASASGAWVMGRVMPAWGFTGSPRLERFQVDPGASEWQIVPWARQVARAYSEGRLPLWNPHQGFGVPLAADAIAGPFDVLRLPVFVSAAPVAWDVYYLARSVLGLGLAYLFVRSIGLGTAAALYLGIAFVFSGFMFLRGNNHYIEVYFLLPGILWGTERLTRGHFRSGLLITAATIAMVQLAGMPESAILVLAYAAAYGIYRLVNVARAGRPATRALRPAFGLGVSWLAGNCLAAPLLLPFAEYVQQQSVTIHSASNDLGLGHLSFADVALLGVPYQPGLLAFDGHGLDNYSGSAVIALACLGALTLVRLRRTRLPGHAGFALAASLLVGGKLYGAPLINDLGRLPLLNLTIVSLWAGPLLVFSLALLGAHAVHAFSQRHCVLRQREAIAGLMLLGAYLGLVVFLNRGALASFDSPTSFTFFGVAMLAGAEAIILPFVVRRRRVQLGGFVACLIVTVELFILAPHDSLPDRYDPYTEPPFVRFLLNAASVSAPFRTFGTQGVLFPSSASAFGLDDIRALDGLYPGRFFKYVDTFLQPVRDRFTGLQEFSGQPEVVTEGNKWLDLAGVRYVVGPIGSYPGSTALIDSTMAESVLPPTLKTRLSVGGETRSAWIEQPPRTAHSTFTVEAARAELRFSTALDPGVPTADHAAGVQFSVQIDDGAHTLEVYRHVLDPGRDDASQRWVDGEVDLRAYAGRTIEIIFKTDRTTEGPARSAAWGDVRMEPSGPTALARVFRGGADVYENHAAFPRAFVVGQVVGAADQDTAVQTMLGVDFDPARVAVVDGAESGEVVRALTGQSPGGSVSFETYSDQLVRLAVSTSTPGLLILTDAYFPGWQAWLDGRRVPTYPTDLAFRGVLVPAGSHEVEFTYAPASFAVGFAVAAGAALLLGVVVCVATRRRAER